MAYQMSCSSDTSHYHDLRDSGGNVIVGKGATKTQAIEDATISLNEREKYIALSDLEKLQHAIDNDVIRSSTENDILKVAVKALLKMNEDKNNA